MYTENDFLRSLIQNSTDVITLLKEDGTIFFQSASVERLLGYTEDELLGTNVFRLVHPDDLTGVIDAFNRVTYNPEGLLTITSRIKHKDSGWRIFESTGSNQLGHPLIQGVVVNSRDITDRWQTEETLRIRQAQLNTLVESLPFELFGIGRDGKYFLQNETCRRHWGDFIGKRPEEVTGDKDILNIWLDNNRRAFAGETVKGEIEVVVEGEKRYMYNVISPILSKVEVEGIVGFNIDITERRHAENELSKYRDHLEELVARRTEELTVINDQLRQAQKLEAAGLLAGGIAHDFNNILSTIKGAVYILKKKIDQGSTLAKYHEQILSSIRQGTELAQSLLAFSRKQTITLTHLDLNELIKDSFSLLRRLFGEHTEIVLALDNRVSFIMADRNQMQQVLINLAANARDAMPAGGRFTIRTGLVVIDETFKVEKGFGTSGEYVLMDVSDTGSGIEENIRGKIFEPFFTTKGVGAGAGLGLSVTYGIVKQHNGYIDFESMPQKGTTFRVYFPYVKDWDYCSVGHKGISAQEDKGTKKGAKSILFAEDDSAVRKIIGDVLRMEGYIVIEARDGVKALELFADNLGSIDLALLDVRMPGKNGREVYDEIQKMRPGTPVLFVSGYTADIIESEGILREGLNFISKSATPEELLEKIWQIIKS